MNEQEQNNQVVKEQQEEVRQEEAQQEDILAGKHKKVTRDEHTAETSSSEDNELNKYKDPEPDAKENNNTNYDKGFFDGEFSEQECFESLPEFIHAPVVENDDVKQRIEKYYTDIRATLENKNPRIFVVYGELYSGDFSNYILGVYERLYNLEECICCKLLADDLLLQSKNPTNFIRAIEHENVKGESLFSIAVKSNDNKAFIQRLLFTNTKKRLDAILERKDSLLFLEVELQSTLQAKTLAKLNQLDGVVVIKVDWPSLLCTHWVSVFGFNEAVMHKIQQEITEFIQQEPFIAVNLAQKLNKLADKLSSQHQQSNDAITEHEFSNLYRDILQELRSVDELVDYKLRELMENGWQYKLNQVLFGLLAILSEDPPIRYSDLRILGQYLLKNHNVDCPVDVSKKQVCYLGQSDNGNKTDLVEVESQFISKKAEVLWCHLLDNLLQQNDFKLNRKPNIPGLCIDISMKSWPAEYIEKQVYQNYPGIFFSIFEHVLSSYLLLPQDTQDINIIRPFAFLIVTIKKQELQHLSFHAQLKGYQKLVSDILDVAHETLMERLTQGESLNAAQENAHYNWVAYSIGHILIEVLKLNLPQSDNEEVFTEVVRGALRSYEKSRILIEAMGMLVPRPKSPEYLSGNL